MSLKTLQWVSGVGDVPDRHGNYYLNVSFEGGDAGFIGGKPEKIEEHHTALTALLHKEAEFLLEEKGTTAKGAPKFKIVGYPGWEKTVQGGGPNPPERTGSTRGRSPELEQYIQERMDRRTAIMQATGGAVWSGDDDLLTLFRIADAIYSWLRETSGTASSSPPSAITGAVSDSIVSAPRSDGSAGRAKGGDGLIDPEPVHPATADPGVGADTLSAEGNSNRVQEWPPQASQTTADTSGAGVSEEMDGALAPATDHECPKCHSKSNKPSHLKGFVICNDCRTAWKPA